ncbi:hypothetical protein J4G43_026645 [Bradyrhizobium barranii subsp. barranii]|uniref:Uncharacterized protein n=1 Tax=Bradyrhizobium barranii subsp. barranii TaxID=2823807 RepID=A0A939S5Q4_9BRAD|nr:hypothetical protein [Bradyrhizobium barranii]UEM08385.1 hypothetical protein J4G43_026645 [Bradyrhizobium barranii subsp. barranii]
MIITMTEHRVKRMAKRLQRVLDCLGIDLKYSACLELAARLCGFDSRWHYVHRDLDARLTPFDEFLSDNDFAIRDEFQMKTLEAAGLGVVARELLDRVNPTGSWARHTLPPAEL